MMRGMRATVLTIPLILAACGGPSTTGTTGGGTTPGGATGLNDPGWHCFELSWTDKETGKQGHNSECLRSDDLCADDVNSMKLNYPEATYNGCFHQQQVYCYSTGGDRPLCFVNESDCQNSRAIIGGGACQIGEPAAGAPVEPPPTTTTAEGGWHCFGVGWDDQGQPGHNSECVRDKQHCENDLAEMKGYFAEGQYTNGCFHLATAYCFKSASMERPLCYQDQRDCENGKVTMRMTELSCVPTN